MVGGVRMRSACRFLVVTALGCCACGLSRGSEAIDLLTHGSVARIDAASTGDEFGVRLAACDVNGDGIGDVVIGSDTADGPGETRGAAGEVYVVYGRRGAWSGAQSIVSARAVTVYGQESFDVLGLDTACGDVNGDGFDDLVLGAYNASSINNSRPAAGQIHIVLGAPSLPATIDLRVAPGTVLWGAGDYTMSTSIGVADINGDGFKDILLEADQAPDRTGQISQAGRAYIVFGRANWPASIDLAAGADLVVYGKSAYDQLGTRPFGADLDHDGTDELIVTAPLADGPGDARLEAGETYVFRGRASWPAVIDLAQTTPDTTMYGAAAQDFSGGARGTLVGDLDGDGRREVNIGAGSGDSPADDSRYNAGEGRTCEMDQGFPPVVDLAFEASSILWGADTTDRLCTGARVADFDGDERDDWACDATFADGPSNARPDCGEISVVRGRPSFPLTVDTRFGEEDLTIYGALAQDRLAIKATPDLNGDGIAEYAASTALQHATRIGAVWIISPIDSDGDGVLQLDDNCPLVPNPGQADADGDRRGDACQTDYDGDGQGDASDCAPAKSDGGTPAEVAGLVFAAGSRERFEWTPTLFADRYDVARGALSVLDASHYGACQTVRDADPTDPVFVEPDVPAAGDGFFFLVRGRNDRCAVAGTWGRASGGSERVISASGCP